MALPCLQRALTIDDPTLRGAADAFADAITARDFREHGCPGLHHRRHVSSAVVDVHSSLSPIDEQSVLLRVLTAGSGPCGTCWLHRAMSAFGAKRKTYARTEFFAV